MAIGAAADPVRDEAALCVVARERPRLFADLMLAQTDKRVFRHAIHALIQAFHWACREAQVHDVYLAPPEHAKTSQLLPAMLWELGREMGLKCGLVSADIDLTKQHLIRLRKMMLAPACGRVFPAMRPDIKRSEIKHGEWSQQRLYIEGQFEPAFEAYALFGRGEGHRLDRLLIDDAVTEENMWQERVRERTKGRIYGTFLQRLTGGGTATILNNKWHRTDAIHEMREREGFAVLEFGYRGCERMFWRIWHPPAGWTAGEEGELDLWAEVWPERRLRKVWAADRATYQRMFELKDTRPEGCRFGAMEGWARWKGKSTDGADGSDRYFAALDPAGGQRAGKGDFSALAMLRRTEDGYYDVVDCVVERMPPAEQVRACFDMHEEAARLGGRGGLDMLRVEVTGADRGWIEPVFEGERDRRRTAGSPLWQMPIEYSDPKGKNKEARIERLGPKVDHGWLRWPEDLEELTRLDGRRGRSWREAVDQMESWTPDRAIKPDHDDWPDALENAVAAAEAAAGVEKLDRGAGAKVRASRRMDW